MPDTKPWTTALDDAGYFVTEPRRVVAEMVADRDSHFTANELVDEAKRAISSSSPVSMWIQHCGNVSTWLTSGSGS